MASQCEPRRRLVANNRLVAFADACGESDAQTSMKTPAYSVVIPTFRRGDSLAECLQSVCALDYPVETLEVIIVDNGGAQNTRSAAEPFSVRLRIRYLVNSK